ncbi:MAG: DNA polymerase II [Kiritimatiellae bacterium]|nr:DNA polymerase II [Kiritimatiellia bacterium]
MATHSVIDTSKMSEGKRQAVELTEAAREAEWQHSTFAGQLFMGHAPWELIYPFPAQSKEDYESGNSFLDKLETLLRDKVDPDQIDVDGEIPQEVIDALAQIGAFGIKVPESYGGLGLSQTNYCRAAILLGSYCGNLTALISAHQSIGIPQPLLLFGTETQKQRFLPRIAKGEISAFALTEVGVGSDPAKMETKAEVSEDGTFFRVNGKKLWCTNGTKAGLIVVMAKTAPKIVNGKERRQTTAFIVETNTPGLTIKHRCHFMGLRSLYNAVVEFDQVKVPRENIILEEGKGLKMALTTLNTGRLTLPAACVGLAKRCLEVTRKWSAEHIQWGLPIGQHGSIAAKISMMASKIFAMESMTLLTSALVDRKQSDIRIEAAMCKMWCSETAWRIVDETMATRGGRGYETAASLKARGEDPVPVERFMRDCRINMIFEGSSEIMRLFIAREALDPHLKTVGEAMNPKASLGKRILAGSKAGLFYAGWYPRQWLSVIPPSPFGMHPVLLRHANYAAKTAHILARKLFHAMIKHGLKLENEQTLLNRYVDIGTELFAITASCSRAQSLIDENVQDQKDLLFLADYFCRQSRQQISEYCRGISHNNDRQGYQLAQHVLTGGYQWLEEGVV